MHANAKYKDSVFSLLFSKPELLRELYVALEGVDLPDDVPVTINTLQDVLFMDRINNISFEIDGKLIVLLEHQSTVNPNIPLRMLMYIARLYEQIIGAKNIYASTRITIPRVIFILIAMPLSIFANDGGIEVVAGSLVPIQIETVSMDYRRLTFTLKEGIST